MTKSNKIKIVIFLLLTTISIVSYVLLRIGIGFGDAVSKTSIGIHNAKKEWKQDSINPVDTIKNQLIQIIDSSTLDKQIKIDKHQ